MSKLRLISIATLVAPLPVFLAPVTSAQAVPLVCYPYSNNSNTSSDSSMFVKAYTYTCYPNYDGQMSWEAYTGGSYYVTSAQVLVCGNTYTISGNSYEVFAGQALYSSTCSGDYGANYGTGSLNTYTFPFGSTSVIVSVTGWSGNCSTYGSGSACTASTSATDP